MFILDEHGKVNAGFEMICMVGKVRSVYMKNILFHMFAVEETLVCFV